MQNNAKYPPKSPLPARETDIPVYSMEAEQAVLGSILSEPHCLDNAYEKLSAQDFFNPAHQILFQALIAMNREQKAIDIVNVLSYLSDRKLDETVGGAGYLAQLSNSFGSPLNIGSYIATIAEKSSIRKLQQAAVGVLQSIKQRPTDVAQLLGETEDKLIKIGDSQVARPIQTASEVLDKTLAEIRFFRDRKQPLTGIPTGFFKLNELTSGWQPGDMIVLAARPGGGKTALALSFAKTALNNRYNPESDSWEKPGSPVGIFSMEMTNKQLMMRLTSMSSGESLLQIRNGQLDDFAMQRVESTMREIKTWPLCLDDDGDLTVHQLRSKARLMKKKYKIELLIVDYLQLLSSDSPQARDNRQNEVSQCSRAIKALAKELGIPVIVLSQLNRKADEKNTEPGLHNLRESGAIEQDADVVLILHRLDDDDQDDHAPKQPMIRYKLKVAKQRSGPTDDVLITFNSSSVRFEDTPRYDSRKG